MNGKSKKFCIVAMTVAGLLAAGAVSLKAQVPAAAEKPKATETAQAHPIALFPFEDRGAGAKEMGIKVFELLYAKLDAQRPTIALVDRKDIEKVMTEQAHNLSAAVDTEQAVRMGAGAGAKLVITGSVIETGNTITIVAKLISTETTRVLAESVEGNIKEDLGALTSRLSEKLIKLIKSKSSEIVAKPVKEDDRLAAVKAKLGDSKLPLLFVKISERHVGNATSDPAAQTEVIYMAQGCGFEIIDSEGDPSKADVLIEGQGFSEFAMKKGNLVSVKARLEVKAVDQKTGKILAIDRQNAAALDITEQVAAKNALQDAAARIAERLLPKIVGK